jgi:Cof subfamily protein (haloacid dehalogenase superfamily)
VESKGSAMDSMIRMILTDMDGTLLSPDLTVSSYNLQAISDARTSGIDVAIATGRPDLLVRDYVRQLEITLPVVSCNGALIRDCATEEIIHMQAIPPDSAAAILELCLDRGVDCLAYTPYGIWFPRYSRRIVFFHEYNELARAGGTPLVDMRFYDESDLCSIARIGVVKVFLGRIVENDIEEATSAIRSTIPGIDMVNSVGDSRDIMAAGTSKGEALRMLAAHAGIDPCQVAAFGDAENDISMFEAAGISFAMGNSPADVREAAMHITASNREDGFAKAVYQHILRKA